ncbi:MAG TPA: hypothetical protein VHE30_11295 [Polyangiaceae bacterium]|nr:hypothetical protein [Polyangiaceae bacterium]
MKSRSVTLLVGLALVTSATLALEVLFTRLLSVVTWYSLAFLVIAMGLFGLTAGALHVYLGGSEYEEEKLPEALARAARWFSLAVPPSLAFLLAVPLSTAPVFTTVVLFLGFSAAIALPFYPAGIVVAAALTRTRLPVGRVYAVDLVGAAAGAPLVSLALGAFGAETSILLVGVVAAVASVTFASAGTDDSAKRAGKRVLVLMCGLALANALSTHGMKPIWVKGRQDVQRYDFELWNSHSRIRMWDAGTVPAMMWGTGSKCTVPPIAQHVIEIDGGAGTALYEAPESMAGLDFIACDVTDVAAEFRPGGAAAIIGVGGTRDLQAALRTGHAPVYGIEFNSRILELLRGPVGKKSGVPTHPSVRLVEDEGRSYMARTNEHFRLIQASLVDTWAATGAGAHALGENGLYTVEAWRTFLDRLEPEGVLTISRWAQEAERLTSLAMGTVLDAGYAHPRRHVAFVATPAVVTVLVSKSELSAADVARLQGIADERGFLLVGPETPVTDPAIQRMLDAPSRAELDRVTLTRDTDYRPPTDDRPYFFNVLPVEAAWRTVRLVNMGTIEGNLLATRTLVLAFLASLALVTSAIVVPLVRRARPRGAPGGTLSAGIAYFLLIGVGFMLVEVALLQRLGLVLGQPAYSLVVVVTSLVGGTGLGALASDRLPLDRAPACYVFPLVLAAAVAALAALSPAFAAFALPREIPVRIAYSVAITAGLGALLGVAFPAGMRLATRPLPDEAPWFWGMNGVGSVLASSVAVMLAERWGLRITLFTGALCYVLVLIPVAVLVRARRA